MDADEHDLLREARAALEPSCADEKYTDDTLICECLCISAGDIRSILKNRVIDIKFLRNELMLGSGCSSCTKSFCKWKSKI